ncbi:uncharacterized protein N0V89_012413 [Didymosphaeria variabile]|uniref:RING-type domain-containing protein n=1 Tax=Didymosphaeria variabile TaxID=1932322 RepID=A0A9W9C500_9PLEO|nr:uncharacterized protein N0V89_012413 [Didymosphaeria variabile]KAJ4344669.1 hypothetical protein N0V89_012413 [Didymosphaeria variabile]
MPKNPQYECPRTGNMYQESGDVYYCSFHDRYAKDRCQAFFDFGGCGMQCPELHTMINDETGRKYCDKHEPTSEIPEVVNWTKRMTEWLTEVAIAESSRKDDVYVAETIADEAEAVARPEESAPKPQSESASESELEEEATDIDLRLQILSLYLSQVEVHTKPEQQQQHGHAVDQKAKAESESQPEQQNEHIASLYFQCNICLENHNAADMNKIEACGHQYNESCLQDFLRRKGVRRYNCAGCRYWLQQKQGL